MVDDPNEHAAYCMMCDAPNYNGRPICDGCELALDQEESDDDLSWEETAALAAMNIHNGNITDAINLIMYDGDVRADSVKAALRLVIEMQHVQYRHHDDIITQLIRLIDAWERT